MKLMQNQQPGPVEQVKAGLLNGVGPQPLAAVPYVLNNDNGCTLITYYSPFCFDFFYL